MAKNTTKEPLQASKTPSAAQSGGDKGRRMDELIDMPEAIRLLKTTRPTFYRWLRSGKIKGMKVGRQWRFYREDIERFLKGEEPRVDLPADITPLIGALRRKAEELGAKDVAPADAGDVQRAVSMMIVLGVAMKASDIHLAAYLGKTGEPLAELRYRVDGVLHPAARIDVRLLPAVVAEWKRVAACDIHEKALPQDGRILVAPSESIGGRAADTLDLRVCFLPASLGESVTVRILDRSTVRLELGRIDFAPRDRERLLRALKSPWGLILFTGPTGSGKTTVLYACINEVASEGSKVMTVEDPVEFFLPGVVQVQVRDAAGLTFERAVRAMLRSDPDVLLIGEVRNCETLSAAAEAALTGHLVLTTLHADEAANALVRMTDIGLDPFVTAESTKLVVAQRLVRKLCPQCSVRAEPDPGRLETAAELARKGGLAWPMPGADWRKPVGCEKCARTGYRGRTIVAEVLEVTHAIGKALRGRASVDELRSLAVSQGMTTMAADGIRRAASGETTLDEVLRVIG